MLSSSIPIGFVNSIRFTRFDRTIPVYLSILFWIAHLLIDRFMKLHIIRQFNLFFLHNSRLHECEEGLEFSQEFGKFRHNVGYH